MSTRSRSRCGRSVPVAKAPWTAFSSMATEPPASHGISYLSHTEADLILRFANCIHQQKAFFSVHYGARQEKSKQHVVYI